MRSRSLTQILRRAATSSGRNNLSLRYQSTTPSPFSTINAEEISHFSKLSSQWWDEKGEFGLLHRMNPVRVEYIRQRLEAMGAADQPEWTFETRFNQDAGTERTGQWLAGKKVLDVGCGGGLLSESLARLGGDTLAIDASASNIAIAQLHASQDAFLTSKASLEYRHTSAEALRSDGHLFDMVCSMEVLEHVDQPGEFLKCLGDMVKPGGYLFLSTISRTPLSQLLTLTMAEDVLRLVTPGTHTYSKFVKPDELRRFFYSDMGGEAVWEVNHDASDVRKGEMGETTGIIYDPLGGKWRLWNAVEGSWMKGLGEGCNYMFSIRKRK
ncbi:hypothetical protein P7C73_g3726, partial [Tremellales sp. Uapishka_1]